jgi:hypothetical protein
MRTEGRDKAFGKVRERTGGYLREGYGGNGMKEGGQYRHHEILHPTLPAMCKDRDGRGEEDGETGGDTYYGSSKFFS